MKGRNTITPAQCRAARGLLNWRQDDLAEASSINDRTIRDFEQGAYIPTMKTLGAIVAAFVKAGVRFVDGGRGVTLKAAKKRRSKSR